jgi:hypothetical protein
MLALFGGSSALRAQGAPPMKTDDTGTPDKGHWEMNVGVEHARTEAGNETALPALEFNYGLHDGVELSYAVAGLRVHEKGAGTETGFSNSEIALKWRFRDGGKTGWSVAVHPGLEFNNPGSSSKRKGLVEDGSTLVLPLLLEREFGEFTLSLNAVHAVHFKHADDWSYGVNLSSDVSEAIALGIELYGTATQSFDRTGLLLNVGAAVKVDERNSLHLAVGRDLHRHDGDKADFVGYLGWQIRL